MLKLLGGNPVLGVLLGAAVFSVGLFIHGPVLMIAGVFVAVVSTARLVSGSGRGRGDGASSPSGDRYRR